ncbi:hypothetical protein AB0K16_41810 [Nonomuraea jabiensis]|uniref:hypothetical protein n=1 Tax=Nonomuraea jabiensis TaxID=882448 RepID=UPI00341FAFDA
MTVWRPFVIRSGVHGLPNGVFSQPTGDASRSLRMMGTWPLMVQEFTGADESGKGTASLNVYWIVSPATPERNREIAANLAKPVPASPDLLSLPGGDPAGVRSAVRL